MITLLGATVGATAPLLLAAIPIGAGILVYIFRKRGPNAPRITSTLFLLSQLREALPARRTFVPPLQFWLELATVLLLALAASGLYRSSSLSRVAIVIDTSKSMAARSQDKESRLDTAKRLASLDISQNADTHRFSIFSAADSLRLISAERVSDDEANDSLSAIQQTHADDQLSSRIASLVASKKYDSVWVYTDKSYSGAPLSSTLRINSIPTSAQDAVNVWIHSAVAIATNAGFAIKIELLSSADSPVNVEVGAECSHGSEDKKVNINSVTTTISPRELASIALPIPSADWRYCRAHVQTRGLLSDALTLDNEAWVARPAPLKSISLVSPLPPDALGLTKLPRLSIQPAANAEEASSHSAIFHRAAPTRVPRHSSLLVLPGPGALPWKGGAIGGSVRANTTITRWAESHPILRYAQPSLLVIPEAASISCPDSASAILFSPSGALACAGEEGGARYVITGFELFPFDGMGSPTLSVLTLNILQWLFGASGEPVSSSPLGTVNLNQSATSINRVAPAPERLTAINGAVTISRPSVLSIATSSSQASEEEIRAFNSFSDLESDISRTQELEPTLQQASVPSRSREDFPLERQLAIAALVVLVADLLRRLWRKSLWGQV